MRTPRLGCPSSVPWAFLIPHEDWVRKNHAQILEELIYRGGLCSAEIVAVVEGREFRIMDGDEADRRLVELLDAWESARSAVHGPEGVG